MKTPRRIVRLDRLVPVGLAFLTLALSNTNVLAAGSSEWRYWQAQQGLADSFVGAVSRDQAGGIWMVHGDASAITRYDGRNFNRVKSPSLYKRFDSIDGRNGWTVDPNGLHMLRDGQWTSFASLNISVASHQMRSRVIDLGNSRAILLYSDRLTRITASSDSSLKLAQIALPPGLGTIGNFISFERAPGGGVWIIGQRGAAYFLYNKSGGLSGWEISPLGSLPFSDLETGIACPNGEFFASGVDPQTKQSVALRLWRGKWEVVARQRSISQTLLAWRDGNGDLWKSDNNILFRKPATEALSDWERVDTQSQVLSGKLAQVLVNPDGSFFVATARGLALHVNSAWKTFGSVLDSKLKPIELQQALTSALEDRRKRLWFLAQRSLFRFSQGQWDEYPFSGDYQIDVNDPSALGELRDGRILIQLYTAPYLILFDPEKLTFSSVRFDANFRPIIFSPRRDGRLDVAMAAGAGQADAIAILDGDSISEMKPIDSKWNLIYPRAMLRSRKGALWLGGTTGLFRLANDKYERLPPKNSGADWEPLSAYSFLEIGDELLVGGRKALYRWTGNRLELLSDHAEATRKLIQDRSGTIWAASGSGVFRDYHRQGQGRSLARLDWFANDESEGLPSSVVQTLLEDYQGRVWAATSRGPAVFRENTDHDAPRASILSDQNSSEAASTGQIQVIFSGEDKWGLTPPDLLQFSYRLDGGEWSPFSASKIASLHGTTIGKHEFEVVAMDRNGNVGASSAHFSFTVLAPWYRSTGFVGVVSLSVLIIAYLVWLAIRHLGQLKEMATRDSLTGNWNRRTIFQLLTTALEHAKRNDGAIAVIMVDVDNFKSINDEHGHPVGDLVLREVARRLRLCIRGSDQLGRYGGEEFLIVVPNCEGHTAMIRAEELRGAVDGDSILIESNGITITCTCSIGVSWTDRGLYDLPQLLREADAALYQAKHAGRNRVGAVPLPILIAVN